MHEACDTIDKLKGSEENPLVDNGAIGKTLSLPSPPSSQKRSCLGIIPLLILMLSSRVKSLLVPACHIFPPLVSSSFCGFNSRLNESEFSQ